MCVCVCVCVCVYNNDNMCAIYNPNLYHILKIRSKTTQVLYELKKKWQIPFYTRNDGKRSDANARGSSRPSRRSSADSPNEYCQCGGYKPRSGLQHVGFIQLTVAFN